MTQEEKDEVIEEIYEAIRFVAQDQLGRAINDDKADALLNAISAYLGEPDDE